MNTLADQKDLPHIIVVDDEADLREMVCDYLSRNGFFVRGAESGAVLDRLLTEAPADLVLLDVNMPSEDGLTIARRLRQASRVAIVMLTAADDVVDKIVGLEIGADDYVTKPFDLRELKARLRAVLRRVEQLPATTAADLDTPPAPAPKPGAKLVPFGKLFIDLEARELLDADGTTEPLTAMEFELIEVFLQNPHRVLTRDRLLDLAHHGRGTDPFDRSIDIRIARIRKKIEADPAKPQTIKTVRGAGYLYAPGRAE